MLLELLPEELAFFFVRATFRKCAVFLSGFKTGLGARDHVQIAAARPVISL
jgi:hypothetical protein